MTAAEVAAALRQALGGSWALRPLGASGFCETWRAQGAAGALFVKSASASGAGMLDAEADGLRALAATGTIRVPQVACVQAHAQGARVLAMEWLELLPPDAGFGERLGEALAALHGHPAPLQPPAFGWHGDNYIGATPQLNTPSADWVRFFAECRLQAMLRRLGGRGGSELEDAVNAVVSALPALFEDAPLPALIHGDLWQGNWGMLADGAPVIFDPAVSCSHAEAELAMMELFGSPPAGFAQAYADGGGVRRDARRTQAYQLYHLLNHAVLFGGGYARQALACARAVMRG